MVTEDVLSLYEVSQLLGKSKETLRRWDNSGKLTAFREPMSNYRYYKRSQLEIFDELKDMSPNTISFSQEIIPNESPRTTV